MIGNVPFGNKGLYEWGSRVWKLLVRLGDEDVCHKFLMALEINVRRSLERGMQV